MGGGEEVWLFLNRVLVLQVRNDADSASMTCKSVDISPAAQIGKRGKGLERLVVVISQTCSCDLSP